MLTKPLFIIKSPYTGKLIKPQKVTPVLNNSGLILLKEYPPIESSQDLDYYGVQVLESCTYNSELEAYKALVNELLYELKSFNNKFDSI